MSPSVLVQPYRRARQPRLCNSAGLVSLTESTLCPPTAGQERFRSISRLYYRGANACILCYSITDASSFEEMGVWLNELRRNLSPDIIIHVVGTKADIVAKDPSARQVPFERVIAYVAEHLSPGNTNNTPPPSGLAATPRHSGCLAGTGSSTSDARQSSGTLFAAGAEPKSPSSKRSSGFWAMEAGWDACHEISAESGEGVEEVFRVVTRKLVEQHRQQQALALATYPGSLFAAAEGVEGPGSGYGTPGELYSGENGARNAGGSFRVGVDRRSWVFAPGFPASSAGIDVDQGYSEGDDNVRNKRRRGKCC